MLIYSKRSPSGCLASCPMWANIPRYIHPPHRPIPRPRGTHAHLHVHRHTGDFITNPAQKRRHATHRCALKMWTVCWQRQQATGAGKPPCTMKSKCTQVRKGCWGGKTHTLFYSAKADWTRMVYLLTNKSKSKSKKFISGLIWTIPIVQKTTSYQTALNFF